MKQSESASSLTVDVHKDKDYQVFISHHQEIPAEADFPWEDHSQKAAHYFFCIYYRKSPL